MKPTDFTKEMGQRIRSLRLARGLSQEKLAEATGTTHPTYISEIELGKANASISIFNQLAKGLGMSLSELVEMGDRANDAALTDFIDQVRMLDDRQRKIYLEAAEAVLKGMKEF